VAKTKRYKFNPETLVFEIHKLTLKDRLSRGTVLFLLSIVVSVFYYFLFTSYFGMETPKLLALKREAGELNNRMDLMNKRFQQATKELLSLQMRDNFVYRPIFGMEDLPTEVRNAGFGGENRYDYLENFDLSGSLTSTVKSMDVLYKRAYIQSKSFDEVASLSLYADQMSLCVPAIPPVNITARRIRYSSPFGYRRDPFHGMYQMHSGIDLSGPVGELIYATGNGKVASVSYDYLGYGNFIIVDHGFGYKTRYAHLSKSLVPIGKIVRRGEPIALMGNTGRSKGPHLHYEVIYRNSPVNPVNYFKWDITPEEFTKLISPNG
jgi:murein DD-endopeptidase MepM/ murein hydrolase activator NlpD